jgi:hypothetical protein
MARYISPALLVTVLLAGVYACRDAPSEPAESELVKREPERRATPIPAESEPEPGAAPTGVESIPSAAGESLAAFDLETRALLTHLANARIARARPISKRSLSLRLCLREGPDAAFKPLLTEKRAARYEVAAFRVSRLLGLDFVPPSVMRRIPVDNFEWMLGEDHAAVNLALREQAHLDDRSGVWGAAISWIDGLEPSELEGPAGSVLLTRLLALDGPSPDREPLAADASAMVVFRRVASGRLVLLDNNGAFAKWSDVKQTRMDDLLGTTFRFSGRLIESVRSLSVDQVERALAQEPSHQTFRLLTRRELGMLLVRRAAILARVDGLIAEHGEDRVLVFP